MDDERIKRVLRRMSLPRHARLISQIAHEICVREGASVAIDGTIASLRKKYTLTLQSITCQDGAALALSRPSPKIKNTRWVHCERSWQAYEASSENRSIAAVGICGQTSRTRNGKKSSPLSRKHAGELQAQMEPQLSWAKVAPHGSFACKSSA